MFTSVDGFLLRRGGLRNGRASCDLRSRSREEARAEGRPKRDTRTLRLAASHARVSPLRASKWLALACGTPPAKRWDQEATTMSHHHIKTTPTTKHDVEDSITTLRSKLETLRGEAKLRLHLAGMELKTEWAKLEPEIEDIERTATEATRKMALDAVHKLEWFIARLTAPLP
jgi:hypothetical protein